MASKSKRRRRVLGASCILAALIVGASSFAWFTSKDEVTNRLTATADYGVTLVEDFKPPEDMTPGQKVNKDVSAVNTGSVDAFVRTSITNAMDMKRINTTDLTTTAGSGTTYFKLADGNTDTGAMTGSADALVSAATPDAATKLYDLRTFGDASTVPPATAITLNAVEKFNIDGTKEANEVTTLMAGGQVVVEASVAVAPDKQSVRSGDTLNGGYDIIYSLSGEDGYFMHDNTGYYKVTKDQDGVYRTKAATSTDASGKTISVVALVRDYSGTGEYRKTDNGLYIFKRSTDGSHSGFFYKDGTFYALENEAADGTGTNNTAKLTGTITYDTENTAVVKKVEGIKFLTEDEANTGTWTVTFADTEDGTYSATPNANTKYMKATYHVTADGATITRDVVFIIKLDDDWATNWTYVAPSTAITDGAGYFYYNYKLNSGVTSEKLIDSVKLDSSMTRNNYSQLTYDLKVALDSAQVTKDQDGAETAEAITGWGVTADLTKTDGVITSIAWSTT